MAETLPEARTGEARSTDVAKGNGHARYDSTVEARSRPSKEEVESMLRSRTDSISSRLTAIQREVTDTGDAIKSAITDNVWLGVGAALVGGVLVGLLLTRRRGDGQGGDPSADTPNGLAELVTRSVKASLEEGADPTEQVAALLERVQGSTVVERPAQRKAGATSGLLRTVGFSLLNMAVRQAVSRISPAGSDSGASSEGSGERSA